MGHKKECSNPAFYRQRKKSRNVYKSRRVACGLQMYSALKTERADKQRQVNLWAIRGIKAYAFDLSFKNIL